MFQLKKPKVKPDDTTLNNIWKSHKEMKLKSCILLAIPGYEETNSYTWDGKSWVSVVEVVLQEMSLSLAEISTL